MTEPLRTEPQFYIDDSYSDGGRVMFACPHQDRFGTLPNAVWLIVQREPLTVTPSVHNTICGCHGWIRNGKWEAC